MRMRSSLIVFLILVIISCRPKVADKEVAKAYEKYVSNIIESFTKETTQLYNDSGEIFEKSEKEGVPMTSSDSLRLFEQRRRCTSIVDVAFSQLSNIAESEEIVNYDKGQLKKLMKEYVLKTKEQIDGPLYKLLKFYSTKRTSDFDSLRTVYLEEYKKQMDSIKNVTLSISKLPYYKED